MIDRTPRYAPSHVHVLGHGIVKATAYVAHPPGNHPKNCAIRNDMTALEIKTPVGRSRWYGFERAFINSELRMVVIGFDARDEVRSKWEVCEVTP